MVSGVGGGGGEGGGKGRKGNRYVKKFSLCVHLISSHVCFLYASLDYT